ncbi:SRPBCC family protein [Merismopedia glauca]|uniref:Cyclase n=1 Tax=Merismopedia glauca CCAP 1448/3 TaxID=1296344 RepID=A0A2T1CAI0_9CYAN|nr:SRPBCC family protein [Merismopedia glauca]PSB05239.1 cyclase [Merismopedia glauca CCAP 1448/3]
MGESTELDLETELEESEIDLEPADVQDVSLKTEQLEGRKRRLTACIDIPHPVGQVWQVLSDYEALSEFIPNLAKSKLIERPDGGIRLEQVGSQKVLRLKFSARVVLDLEETFPHTINFQMVEGDFKSFAGSWNLEPINNSNSPQTHLCYILEVTPKLTMPVGFIESRIRKDLPANLLAIRQRTSLLEGERL